MIDADHNEDWDGSRYWLVACDGRKVAGVRRQIVAEIGLAASAADAATYGTDAYAATYAAYTSNAAANAANAADTYTARPIVLSRCAEIVRRHSPVVPGGVACSV